MCIECGGSGVLTCLGGDWGKTPETTVPCWRCQPAARNDIDIEWWCEQCSQRNAQVVITLNNGAAYEVCSDCVIECIREKASTENPVFGIEWVWGNGIEQDWSRP